MEKIPGIKIIFALPIVFILFLSLLSRPWDNPTPEEIYQENYINSKFGMIEKKTLWKGCGLQLKFYNPNRTYISLKKDTSSYSIGNNCDLNEQIRRNDYFHKLPESNKCFIIRNDSILLFNCETNMEYELSKMKLPINNIEQWNIKGDFEWKEMPYKPVEIYLKNEEYKKYKFNN